MNEPIEDKKWIIDRIEHILDGYSRGIETNKQRFEKDAEEHLSDKKSDRDITLAFLGIAISVMLGVSATPTSESATPTSELIKQLVLFVLLFGILPAGLIIFLAITIAIRRMSKEYLKIEETYLQGITFTNAMRTILAVKTFDLKMELQELEVLGDYFRIIEAGIILDIIIKTREAIDKHILDEVKYLNLIYHAAIRRVYALYETYTEDTSPKAKSLKSVLEQDSDLFNEFNAYAKLLREEGREQIPKVMKLAAKRRSINPFFFSNPSARVEGEKI
jgi:hypothetical protein